MSTNGPFSDDFVAAPVVKRQTDSAEPTLPPPHEDLFLVFLRDNPSQAERERLRDERRDADERERELGRKMIDAATHGIPLAAADRAARLKAGAERYGAKGGA